MSKDLKTASPREVRALIRAGEITSPTAGMAAGYAQANLVILPAEYAADFAEYARINPAPCPVLETLKASPYTRLMAADGNILTDIPKYRIYRNGAPVHIGDPKDIGIADVMRPDYGDSVEIREGEVCVFWPCGVTPQAAIENAKPPIVITHSPGHMFITDILNSELNDFLEAHKGE